MNGSRSGPGDAAGQCGATSANASDDAIPVAWQPLTAPGVAAFAWAPLGRLLLVQLIVALLAAGIAVWFLHRCWFPTIGDAVRKLPSAGMLRSGTLEWSDSSPLGLAESRFLALVVDLEHTGEARSPAQVQVEFGRKDFKVISLLGSGQWPYPRDPTAPFNSTELVPWWGAWAPAFLAMAAVLSMACLMVSWVCLATVYCLPAWIFAFFANRHCSLGGCWRVAGAALMPGALFLLAVILIYGSGALDLVRLAVGGAAHVVIGWAYLFFGLLRLPQHRPQAEKANPFA